MKRTWVATLMSLAAAVATAQTAADSSSLRLVGDWSFQNTQTKVKYGGAFEVVATSEPSPGRHAVRVTYDGRETNDRCSTKTALGETPVDGVLVKTDKGYDLEFILICPMGPSPRPFKYSLTCDPQGTCTQATARPWGEGLVRLVRQ